MSTLRQQGLADGRASPGCRRGEPGLNAHRLKLKSNKLACAFTRSFSNSESHVTLYACLVAFGCCSAGMLFPLLHFGRRCETARNWDHAFPAGRSRRQLPSHFRAQPQGVFGGSFLTRALGITRKRPMKHKSRVARGSRVSPDLYEAILRGCSGSSMLAVIELRKAVASRPVPTATRFPSAIRH